MKQFDRLNFTAPPGGVEVLEKRTAHSKLYRMPNAPDGRQRGKLMVSPGAIHYDNAGTLEDVDLAPVSTGTHFEVSRADYTVTVDKATGEVNYTGAGGNATMRLTKLNDIDLSSLAVDFSPTITDDEVHFGNLVSGLDVFLKFKPRKIEWFKRIKTALAPTSLTWGISESLGSTLNIGLLSRGGDANGENAEITMLDGGRSRKGDRFVRQLTETFTGRVSRIVNQETRQKDWFLDFKYPVLIDAPDITENITANAQDGNGLHNAADYWYVSGNGSQYIELGAGGGGYISDGGWRFTTIAIDQGVTIDDNTFLKIYRGQVQGTPPSIIFYADDVDNATANFSASDMPHNITKTTASVTPTIAGGLNSIDVKAIVQEIVDRGSWANNNNMRFAGLSQDNTGTNVHWIEDYAQAGTNEAVLEIYYTAAGGAAGIVSSLALMGVGN